MENALILAGGKSSRMGLDKTLLAFENSPSFTHFLYFRLKNIFQNVKVSAKNQKFNPPLPLIKDDFEDFCPLFVLASLDLYFDKKVFIIPADTPFIKEKTIKKLFLESKNYEICVAKDKEKIHNLCGFFDPSISKKARNLLENGQRKIKNLLEISNTKFVDFEDGEQFLNLNTKEDLRKINEISTDF